MSSLAPRPGRWSRAPRPARWTLRPLPSYFNWVWWPFLLHSWLGQWLPFSLGRWPLYYFTIGTALFLVAWLVRLVREGGARARTRRDRAFSDLPDGIEEFAVEAAFAADGRYLGMDRGVVWFEDGLMRFSGGATSFVLAASDVAPSEAESEVPKDGLLLTTARARAFVRLRPLAGRGMFRFRRRLRRFLRDAEATNAPRQWPPMALYGEPEPREPSIFESPEALGAEAARAGFARGMVRRRGGA